MRTKVWKRILPLFLSIVMLFSVFAAAIPTASALEVSAPSVGTDTDDSPYYRIVFEDGMLRIQLNPQKVYDLLRDGSVSKEDLLNFIPEDVLDALAQGRDLSLEDLKVLVSNYISPSDLSKLKELLPKEVLQDHFDLAMLEDLISVEELLSIVPIDELLNNVDDAEISALITPAVLELLLNEKATDAVLTDEFIENLLDESDVLDAILSNAEVKEELVKLINDAIVDQLLANTTIKSNLLALMERSSTLDNILADETAKTALKNYFNSKKSIVSSFLTDSEVLELLKNMPSVHDSLVTDEVIDRLISSNAINKDNIRTIFSDEQLESLIDDAVLEKLLATDHFVDNFLNDDELVNTIFTQELILELKNQGLLDLSYATDRTQLRSMLLSSAEARALVSDEIHHHPEISLAHYWEHLDFTALVNAIGIHSIQIFVDTHDDVYENILHTLGAAQIAAALGEDVCASILQNNLSDILRTVGMPKLFTYFNRDEIVSTLGGYYAILQKGYVSEEDVVAAVGGYPALMEYLPFDGIIEAIGYDRLLDFVDFNDIVASAGGYATVFSWYSPTELQAILNAIGTDSLQDFLTSNGILQQLNFQQIAKDLLALLRSKGPQYKAFLQELTDRFLILLNTEVASISINDTQIYSPGRFDFEAIVTSILKEIPDVNDFLAMNEGDALAQWILRATIRGEEYQLGISIEFIGDFSELQELAATHADDFVWSVSDDLDVIAKLTIPSVGSELYEKILLSSRIPTELKKKILSAPEMSLSELTGFLEDLSDEELQSIIDTVSEKIDVIREKVYAKLDETLGEKAENLAVAKAKVEQILNAFTDIEKIKTLRNKAVSFLNTQIPSELANKTLASLYEGDQSFRFEGTFSQNYYDKALALLQKLGISEENAVNLLVYFGNSLALDGSIDLTTTLKGIYQLTLKDSEGKTHIFYLPEGIDLSIIKEFFPLLDVEIPDGAVMPSEDTTISAPDIWWQVDFYADGVLVHSVYYLKGTTSLDPSEIPAVPEKLGYSAVWGDYTLGEQEITRVDAVYTKITYTTTIKDDSIFPEDYEFELEYSQADRSLDLPIPEKFGYTFLTWYIDVNLNGMIDEEDIRLERRTMFRMLRSAPALDTFLLPDGEIIPEGDDLALLAEFDITYYDITFVDYDGNPIPGISLSYSPLPEFLDKAALTAQFPSLSLPHYTLAWYVDDTAWENYDLSLGGDVTVTSKKTPITYNVIFSVPGQTVHTGSYTVENTTLPTVLIPTPPVGYETDGEWYVVSVGGEALATPIKLSEYTVAGGDLEIKAIYTAIEYTVTFKYADGTTEEKTYTVDDYSLFNNLPAIPNRVAEGYDGTWYVVSVGGEALATPIKLSEYTVASGDLVIEARYTAIEYTATFYKKDGSFAGTAKFTVEGFIDTIPDVPEIPGYENGKWIYSTPLQPGDMDVHPEYTPIEYTATFKDENGNILGTANFTVEGFLESKPEFPQKPGYIGEWVYPNGVECPPNDMDVTLKYTIITYTVEFYRDNGTLLSSTTYTVDNKNFTIPDVPAKSEYVGEWYVITNTGLVKLSEYVITNENLGDLRIKAVYELKTYTAYFRVDGVVIGSVTFTVETEELSGIPTIPAKRGYSAKWANYELGREDLYIDAIYTIVQYTATFKNEDGKTVGTVDFTINDKSIKAPALPEKKGATGAWYVVKVNGAEIDPVLLSEFELTDADLTIQAMYEAEEKASLAWLWWIIIILILIIVILIVLLILKKKNLPPFKREETPPAIIEAAIPEEEEEEEEELPIEPIVTVESVDVETADELMTDATAIAVVETVETEASAGQKIIVNLHVINDNFTAGDTVDLDALKSKKLVSSKAGRVKILADGTLDKPLTVVADAFSVQAIKMITLTGGHAVQKKSKR
ncbi:MAG: uL15 family ribosomal protein [Clostridia bacterium]|nr:uL15 family ribosomal protein [Clostridia bacterium]